MWEFRFFWKQTLWKIFSYARSKKTNTILRIYGGRKARFKSKENLRLFRLWDKTDSGIKKKKMTYLEAGFLGSSASKESTCNAGDPGLIPGLGRSPGEGRGYPLQYSWASLVAQMVKNPPAMRETWVWSLGWEVPLEEGMTTYSSILAWRIPKDRGT